MYNFQLLQWSYKNQYKTKMQKFSGTGGTKINKVYLNKSSRNFILLKFSKSEIRETDLTH